MFFTKRFITLVSAVLFTVSAAANSVYLSTTTSWNATEDFGPTSSANPNGVWSYGYDPASLTGYQYKAFDRKGNFGAYPIAWGDSTYALQGVPLFGKNTTNTVTYKIQPGQIALHPGTVANGDAAILRFTAPETGVYSIYSKFFSGDIGETDAWVIINSSFSTPLSALGITSVNPIFSTSALSLSSGETLDFVVGNHGDYTADSTPLDVIISLNQLSVPEPNSIWLTILAIIMVGNFSQINKNSARRQKIIKSK